MRDHATIRAVRLQHLELARSVWTSRPDAPEQFEFLIYPGQRAAYKLIQRGGDLVYVTDRDGWSEIPSAKLHQVMRAIVEGRGNGFALSSRGDPYVLR